MNQSHINPIFNLFQGSGRRYSEGCQERGLLQPVEGLHPLLLQAGSPHCVNLHLPGADEQAVQGPRPGHYGRQRWRPLKRRNEGRTLV